MIVRPLSFGRLMALAALAVGACVLLLAASFAAGLNEHRRLQAQGDLARAQALLVTRVEADAAMLALAMPGERAALRAQIVTTLRRYRATIAQEQALIGGDPASQRAQAAERVSAAMLARAIGNDAAGQGDARMLARRIAAAERIEADAASGAIAALRDALGRRAAWLTALVMALLAAIGWAVWRQAIRPIAALVQATGRLAAEQAPVRVAPSGLAELRDLAARFNDMAGTIEAQVAARTNEIECANRTLREVDARRRLFFAKVGHELRTPVTVMRGEAEVALRHGGDDPAMLCRALEQVRDNAGFLDRRIEDLLGIARAEHGELTLHHQPTDLNMIVRESGALAGAFARANGITLSIEGSVTATVRGDPQWLRQALLTVIDNAVKFSPPSGRVVMRMATAGGTARVAVVDQGPGVVADDLDRIFDPYAQSGAGRGRGGAGLGLSLARWIAVQHDGAIFATPAPGGGLSVELSLPVL